MELNSIIVNCGIERRLAVIFDLMGKTALVTGGGRGIGAAIAKLFSERGAKVVVANRTLECAEDVAGEIVNTGGLAKALPFQAGDAGSCSELVSKTVEHYGSLNILVHNAAVARWESIEEIKDETITEALTVNLSSCFWLARAALPHLRRQGGGRVLITSSVTGPRSAAFGLGAYAASKAGVNGFIKSAALEFAPDNITVNGIEPGFIAKPGRGVIGKDSISEKLITHIPLGRMGQAQDIANAMLFLASDEAHYITGQTLIVDGGASLPESPVFMSRAKKE